MKHVLTAKYRNPDKVKVFWTRSTETQCNRLLIGNGSKLIDPDLYRKFGKELKRKGNTIEYGIKEQNVSKKTGKISERFIKQGELCQVLPLSTFFNNKGEALFDHEYTGQYYVILDEMNRESSEANRFDVVEAFANQLENLLRFTKSRIRVICIGNNIDEVSDILAAFNFIPRGYGINKLKRRKCVIHVIEPSNKYDKDRAISAGSLLAPNAKRFAKKNSEEDTTKVVNEHTLKISKPTSVIAFDKDISKWFTVKNGYLISQYKGEKQTIVSMKKYMGYNYNEEAVKGVKKIYNNGTYKISKKEADNLLNYFNNHQALKMDKYGNSIYISI